MWGPQHTSFLQKKSGGSNHSKPPSASSLKSLLYEQRFGLSLNVPIVFWVLDVALRPAQSAPCPSPRVSKTLHWQAVDRENVGFVCLFCLLCSYLPVLSLSYMINKQLYLEKCWFTGSDVHVDTELSRAFQIQIKEISLRQTIHLWC